MWACCTYMGGSPPVPDCSLCVLHVIAAQTTEHLLGDFIFRCKTQSFSGGSGTVSFPLQCKQALTAERCICFEPGPFERREHRHLPPLQVVPATLKKTLKLGSAQRHQQLLRVERAQLQRAALGLREMGATIHEAPREDAVPDAEEVADLVAERHRASPREGRSLRLAAHVALDHVVSDGDRRADDAVPGGAEGSDAARRAGLAVQRRRALQLAVAQVERGVTDEREGVARLVPLEQGQHVCQLELRAEVRARRAAPNVVDRLGGQGGGRQHPDGQCKAGTYDGDQVVERRRSAHFAHWEEVDGSSVRQWHVVRHECRDTLSATLVGTAAPMVQPATSRRPR
mmetsp:Transcript_17185/g.46638  ORF Transcript_17185/g.46638 Transcript_17185/m.46638 type:complete len:342 (-) Transcript_17185:188-1213(-)